jgi:hypothetical protein
MVNIKSNVDWKLTAFWDISADWNILTLTALTT